MAVGQVRTLSPAELSCMTLRSGVGAHYVLIPFFATPASLDNIVLDIHAEGVANALGPASTAPRAASAGSAAPVGQSVGLSESAFDTREHLALRERGRVLLAAHAAGARAWMAAQRSRTVAPRGDAAPSLRSAAVGARTLVTAGARIGDIVSANVRESSDCGDPEPVDARVVAISNHAVVLADTANPTGGFTDEEYASFAATFDTLVHPVDTAAFGAPADIDGNGRVVILFTKAVNALAAPGQQRLFVIGFFTERDLLPTRECATSNVAEMFYLMVPDPAGAVQSNVRTKSFVDSVAVLALAHEYQHLINASRRLYVNIGAEPSEEVWLNEGLSHIAQELLFYRMSGFSPRSDIDAATLAGSSPDVRDAFARTQVLTLGHLAVYLQAPRRTSPYRADERSDLGTRGATWEFLRYAADRFMGAGGATDERSIWFGLVNATTTGQRNVENAFGESMIEWVQDFTVAQFLDNADIGAPVDRYSFPSWNLRTIYPTLTFPNRGCCTAFPLTTALLTNGADDFPSLSGGGATYLEFTETSGPTRVGVHAQGREVPGAVHATLIRTQ